MLIKTIQIKTIHKIVLGKDTQHVKNHTFKNRTFSLIC
jgi:hypothetical protein